MAPRLRAGKRRRSFALPFVLTTALGPLGCGSQSDNSIAPRTEPPVRTEVIANPPPLPQAQPGAPLERLEDGTCMGTPTYECVEGMTCNPPPRQRVQCPPEVAEPPPEEPAEKPALEPAPAGWATHQRPDGTCWAAPPVDCPPPPATCNPPPPRQVACADEPAE